MLPPIPDWDSLHPLIIHFPIALLITSPLLILAGMILKRQRHGLYVAAFLLMLIGTLSSFVAISTGEAAGEFADRNETVNMVIEKHEELAELTRTVFALLTVMFAAFIFGPKLFRKELSPGLSTVVTLAFLLFYVGGTTILANTAHQGGRLVHELGVRALMQPSVTEIPQNNYQTPPLRESRSFAARTDRTREF